MTARVAQPHWATPWHDAPTGDDLPPAPTGETDPAYTARIVAELAAMQERVRSTH